MVEFIELPEAKKLKEVDKCGNSGCAACVNGQCVLTIGECFGFIEVSENETE